MFLTISEVEALFNKLKPIMERAAERQNKTDTKIPCQVFSMIYQQQEAEKSHIALIKDPIQREAYKKLTDLYNAEFVQKK